MTDIARLPTAPAAGAGPPSPTDRRANVGEYLLAMSHEIRAPLNAVIGMSGMLLDSDLGERSRQYAKSVHSAGESLAAILNDLLDLSRVTAGRLAVDPIAFDLRSTIEETASALTPRANDRGLALRVDWRPELPRHVVGDPGRTRQVLGNLIGYAVNATSQGEVVVRVLPDGERGGLPAIRFVVEDTGIGIMPERLARIFDDYVPVDASPYRSFGITGLGLRLSADLVRRMGGEIGAESVAGKGSRFWFVLPMPSAEPRAVSGLPDTTARGGRALIVEADLAVRGRYIEQIEAAGWEFEFVDDLSRVAEMLRDAAGQANPFDACFISDYAVRPLHMEVAVKIKAELSIADTALVMVTAVGSPGEGKKLWHAGFAAYLRKPVPNEEMRDGLTALLSLGPDGRGSALITRHSLAEARNAQAFAPDGIDEMLASLTPAADSPSGQVASDSPMPEARLDGAPVTEMAPIESAPAVPSAAAVSWFVPLFAAAPRWEPPADPLPVEAAAQIAEIVEAEEPPQAEPAIAVLDAPEEPRNRSRDAEPETIGDGFISFETIVAGPVVEEVVDRPEVFDSSAIVADVADGLESVASIFEKPAPRVDGLVGHDFGAPEAPAFVEPVDHLPAGAPIDTDELWIDAAETLELEEIDADDSIELSLEDQGDASLPSAGIEIEVPAVEPPVEPMVEIPEPEPVASAPVEATVSDQAVGAANPSALDIVSPQLVDQLASGGGFFTQYLVMTFLREIPGTIAQLATATNRGDGAKIKETLGALRTVAGFVGAARMAEISDRLEVAVDRGQLDEAAPLIGTIEQAFVEARDTLDAAATTGLPPDLPAVGAGFLEQVGPHRDGPGKVLAIRLIDSFNTDAAARILELRETVARGDAEQAQRIGQTLKGMCGLVSAEPLAKLAALVEADARLKRIGQADRYLDHLDREFERVSRALAAARG